MADSPLVQLNPDAITSFTNNELTTLEADLTDIQRAGGGNWVLNQFTAGGNAGGPFEGMTMPLPLGDIASDAMSTGGPALQSAVEKYVTDLTNILMRQGLVTDDLIQALRQCVTDMKNNQLNSLDQIKLDDAETIFEYVKRDADPAPPTTSSDSNTGGNNSNNSDSNSDSDNKA